MMAVNLSKHGAELSDAYNEVVNGKSDWILLTYEENSYDIHVASKGGGGLDEMVQNLSASKVMYAFCRVTDPNCGVPKLILINWTGEGVTGVRRGVCSNHLQTMANFLRGAHVTINAYSEDDVQPETIISKVSQAGGITYNLHTKSNQFNDNAAPRPMGSVYHKTSGLQDITGTDRETFWAQIEKEEETRRQQERKKAEEEQQRLEKERKNQEERERTERERRQRERAKQIDQQRLFEKRQEINHQNQHQEPSAKYSIPSDLEEINPTARENFWAQLEKEEQTHRQQEKKKAEEERQRLEKERKKQDERETATREQRQRERAKQIDQQRLFEKRQEINQNQNQQHQVERELQAAQWKEIRSSRSVQQANKAEQTRNEQERKRAEEERQRLEKERKKHEERDMAEREQCQREQAKQIDQQRLFEKTQKMNHQNRQHKESGSKYSKSSEEINQTDRETFWAQLEKEEQTRRQQERKKAEEERQRLEKERKEQEERETAEREQRQRERDKQINQQRLQEKKQEAKDKTQQQLVERELQAAQWKGIKSTRSVQEANEAAALISQRAINPRDIFSQTETNFLTNRVPETQPGYNEEENIYDTLPSEHRVYHKEEDDRRSAGKLSAGLQQSLNAKALYDYQASDDTEITFDTGDIITVVEMADEGWWHGYGPDGHYGMFPANYVELI